MPLSNATIRKTKPSDKPLRLFDAGGLYLEVAPSGGKWWRFKYRFDGKEKRLSLGTYPDVALTTARKRRDHARQLLADGTNPGEVRKADARARQLATLNNFKAVALAWLDHRTDAWVERTRTTILRSLENDVFPGLGKRPIADIQPADIRQLVKRIEARRG